MYTSIRNERLPIPGEITMNFVTKFFEDRKQRKLQAEENARLASELLKMRKIQAQNEAAEALEKKIIMESDVPWYKLIGQPYNVESPPLEPISERYEWNKAFIRKLREEGYKGETDSQIIEDWENKTESQKLTRLAEIEREKKRSSSEPWVEIVSEQYDEDTKQVSIKLDWNKAFIKMLRRSGYSGRDDQEIIDKWFKRLSEDIAGDLHSERFDA